MSWGRRARQRLHAFLGPSTARERRIPDDAVIVSCARCDWITIVPVRSSVTAWEEHMLREHLS